MTDSKIAFLPLREEDFPLVHKWFNKPHVQTFYSLRNWSLEEVGKKLDLDLLKKKKIQSFLIYLDAKPIGFIQSYPIQEHPWEGQDLSKEVICEAAGLDLFIGEEEYIQKGYGSQIVSCFLKEYIWPCYRFCLADPDIHNEPSLKLLQKCGFKKHKKIDTVDALNRPVALQLVIKEREV